MIRALFLFSITLAVPFAPAGPAVAGGPFDWPIAAGDAQRITAGFDLDRGTGIVADWTGWRFPETGGGGHAYDDHSGTDTGMANGTQLYACQSGTVNSYAENVPNDDHSNSGNYIILNHTLGGVDYITNCWHLSQNSVVPTSVGQAVTRGQALALSDNTGNSTGPHLHFGISNEDGSGLYTCPYFNGYWTDDELYNTASPARPCLVYLETTTSVLNVRSGNSTSFPVITTVGLGQRLVASFRNGWWRIFLPSAPALPAESRTAGGGVTPAPGYGETGFWISGTEKAAITVPPNDPNAVVLTGLGSRYAPAGAATAQFVPNIRQRNTHEVFVAWPSNGNAANVRCVINHLTTTDASGTPTSTTVMLDQRGAFSAPGAGTHFSPYVIQSNPYIVNHTTIGGDDVWDTYSPVGAGIPEQGPERVYLFTLRKTTTVTASVAHSGYPTLDVDVQIMNSQNNLDCVARNDFTATATLGPGTHCLSVDSYGTGNARATAYTLTVEFSDAEPFANSWVSLGTYAFGLGQAGASGSVTIDASTVTGAVDLAQPVRVYADAVKFVPIGWRSAWISDSFATRINTSTTPVCCVGIANDQSAGNDARDVDESIEVPIRSGPSATAAVVGKALSGQRFVCDQINGDWYRIHLTDASGTTRGWLNGADLFVYNAQVAQVVPAGLVYFGD